MQLDATGNVSITPADVDGGSSDNCAIDFMTVNPNSFTCAEEGPNTVTLEVNRCKRKHFFLYCNCYG